MATARQQLLKQGVWPELLDELEEAYLEDVCGFLRQHASDLRPPPCDVFAAFRLTPFPSVRVVIVGEDPYPRRGVAMGLAFSARTGIPGTLSRIFDELENDRHVTFTRPQSGDLTCWACNGVLLLNRSLTRGQSSHKGKVWERWTTKTIELLDNRESPVSFLLWGKKAWELGSGIRQPHHLIRLAYHPSPRGGDRFSSCRHFSQVNSFLTHAGSTPIPWDCISTQPHVEAEHIVGHLAKTRSEYVT